MAESKKLPYEQSGLGFDVAFAALLGSRYISRASWQSGATWGRLRLREDGQTQSIEYEGFGGVSRFWVSCQDDLLASDWVILGD